MEHVLLRTGFFGATPLRMTEKRCHPEAAGRKIPAVERRATFIYERIPAVLRSMYSYARDSSSLCSAHSSRRSRRVALTGILPLSHASRRAAAGRYFLRLAMPVRALRALPVTARSGTYLPASLLGALSLLRKHAPFFCPRQRSRICPRMTEKRCHPEAAGRRTPDVER